MEINLHNIGRRFNRDWIFRHVNLQFQRGNAYAVLGPNGSGKSTFLQVLSGRLTPSEGELVYRLEDNVIDVDSVYPYLSISAPYLELVEEFTLREVIRFHFHFKPLQLGLSADELLDIVQLEQSADKEIRYFSSGMKQRTKLLLACCSDTPILLLDEPTSNLDSQGIAWYLELIQRFAKDRLVLVCSNQPHEYGFCDQEIQVSQYKV